MQENNGRRLLKNIIFVKMLIRSLFLQAIWNFERMQNVGFAYIMMPLIRHLYKTKSERSNAVLRQLGFFNTHPYMVSIIMGVIASKETQLAKHGETEISPDSITALKKNMSGPLAAVGDTFFWATWRSFIALVTICFAFFLYKNGYFRVAWLIPISFIVFYNIFHIFFRWWTFSMSYTYPEKAVSMISEIDIQEAIKIIKTLGIFILFCALIVYFVKFGLNFENMFVLFCIFIGTVYLTGRKISPNIIFYLTIVVGIILFYIRGH